MDDTPEQRVAANGDAVPEKPSSSDANPHRTPSPAETFKLVLESVKTRAIVFFSNASNETLGACLVGLGAATYIVLGRVGLVLIGVVGGVAWHASWEGNNGGGEDVVARKKVDINRRRETGIEVARRVLEWREKHQTELGEEASIDGVDYSSFGPGTAQALETLTDSVIQNYVKWWYTPILPAEWKFPSSCRQILVKFILSLSSHLSRKRPADAFLDFITNSSSIMIVFLNQLSQALSAVPNATPAEAIQAYLESNPDSSLANILDKTQQQKKLTLVATDILERHVGGAVYRCTPVKIFLREMLSSVALEKVLELCSRSEFINDWIISALEQGEPEIMNVIDHSIEDSTGHRSIHRTGNASVTEDGIVISEEEPVLPNESDENRGRITRMFAEEDTRKIKDQLLAAAMDDDTSDSTRGIATPSSSLDEGVSSEMTTLASAEHGFSMDGSRTSLSQSSVGSDQLGTDQLDGEAPPPLPERHPRALDTFTLHRATITIYDDSEPNDKRFLRSKPTVDYLIQVEPRSSQFSGWMIARTYEDYETLHEVLRRIAAISGARFAETHANLPNWRDLTRPHLRDELERYLVDAIAFESLAESEGMKRFLDKDLGLTNKPPTMGKTPLWANTAALESAGKNVFGAISNAPRGVARGGKAMLGGVASVISGSPALDGRRSVPSRSPLGISTTPLERRRGDTGPNSQSSSRSPSVARDLPRLSMDPRTSSSSNADDSRNWIRRDSGPISSQDRVGVKSLRQSSVPRMQLPPPPSLIPDDYSTPARRSHPATPRFEEQTSVMSADGTAFFDVPTPPAYRTLSPTQSVTSTPVLPARPSLSSIPSQPTTPLASRATDPHRSSTTTNNNNNNSPLASSKPTKTHQPLSEPETQVVVELLFAIITELYTLSSAWQIRLTLLTAAKSFLMRPGNPQLSSMCTLLQASVLDANTSDAGIAAHVLKLRESALPTDEELARWPLALSAREKEERRVKARRLLVERGMPAALTSVMGSAASGEALGKVFDCLQVEEVARGLVFGLLLQGLRAVVQ